MVGTGPLRMTRTQKNEGGKPGCIGHKWRAKVTQKVRGLAHAAALLTMCFVGPSPPGYPLSGACSKVVSEIHKTNILVLTSVTSLKLRCN